MSQAKIIINVSAEEHSHSNGLSGTLVVPAKTANEEFAMLVVYPTPEIQDIGDQRKTVHWLKAGPLAMDVVGLRSDAAAHTMGSTGTKEKWGLLLCEAEPDVPKELLSAQELEIEFLDDNAPDYKMRKDKKSGAIVQVDVSPVEIQERKSELSAAVETLRKKFERHCRTLVQAKEVALAKKNLLKEDARLVAEGDAYWAGNEQDKKNINAIHRRACIRMGQERPWCYVPQNLIDCPGCGAKIKENILSCPHCAGFLDEGIEELRAMKPRDRAMKMYPERYADPVQASGVPKQPRA
ncbi:MAG TPA: zinc ribbon domain-containing protein [Candidatus Angelobacter sp.]|jgi:hypothetical protein|nr:zinc ribbon domain-containing protein [Candidatus Angelobacter sp.]